LNPAIEERMRMKSRLVAVGLVGLMAVVLNSCTATHGTGSGTLGTGFMWITTQGDQLIRAYNINLSTGATTQIGASVPTGLGPIAIAITPAGDAVFVANRDDNTISAYSTHSDGSLTASGTPISAGQTPKAMAVDPTGGLLFVADEGTDTISVFAISAGALAPKASFPIQTPPVLGGSGPVAVVVSPIGFPCNVPVTGMPGISETCFSLYVANQIASTITAYEYYVDSNKNLVMGSVSGGIFTAGGVVAGSPYQAGTNPSGLAFSRCAGTTTVTTACPTAAPPGYLFVANSGSNSISIFSACIQMTPACPSANGTLSQVGSPVGSSGTRPVSFIIDPAVDFVYAVNNGSFQVSQYHFNSATGALSLISPSSVSTGANPLSGGITSDGQWVFVPNNGGSSVSSFSLVVPAGTTPTGNMVAGTAITLVGQPSAVLVR
jgi:DNA-binding beta-propeller fold protein YncE